MNAVDASNHFEVGAAEQTPSLLTIVIDTNPRAWAALGSNVLSISRAIANILVFVNAHLAFGTDNSVAIVAAHCNRAVWLYPTPPDAASSKGRQSGEEDGDGDVEMRDGVDGDGGASSAKNTAPNLAANKYPQFAAIERSLLTSLAALIAGTSEEDLAMTTTSQVSGALTLALSYINKMSLQFASTAGAASDNPTTAGGIGAAAGGAPAGAAGGQGGESAGTLLHARILVVSVSDSEPAQYIPTMNAVFAAAHSGVAIDVLALRGQPTFLQQASFLTRGTYIAANLPRPAPSRSRKDGGAANDGGDAANDKPYPYPQQGILSYLMLGFLGACSGPSAHSTSTDSAAAARDQSGSLLMPSASSTLLPSQSILVPPAPDAVDFRAACFCHRRVVDTAFVCSVCLSIFCEIPPNADCPTCGSKLALGNYGAAKPAVVPRKRKKKKRPAGAGQGSSAVGTPVATPGGGGAAGAVGNGGPDGEGLASGAGTPMR